MDDLDRCVVVIVDDHPEVADSLALLVEGMGYGAITLTDARDVADVVDFHRPHIVLMDIDMPEMNGWDVAAHLRQCCEGRHLALVAVTGLDSAEARHKSAGAGFDAHVVKPLRAQTLEDLIRRFGHCKATS